MNNDTLYRCTYDAVGNIVNIWNLYNPSSYEYDSLNQLIRENNKSIGKTYTYTYSNGNITERKEYAYTTGELGEVVDTKTWSYTDSTWRDLLTNFNGTAITYDTIGNPLTIGTKSLTWMGRQLEGITDGDNNYSYAYNMNGQRVSKTVNGVKTEYFYNGSTLAGQKTGNNTLIFMNDENGDPFAFTYNGSEYFYVKNAQNDITGIIDSSTRTLIAMYNYDAWGNIISVTDAEGNEITDTNHIAHINPLRYRSYYFDSETGFYYLKSRYYSPEMCRFINADEYVQTGQGVLDKNMFAYCQNNPVLFTDSSGKSITIALLVICTLTISSALILSGCSRNKPPSDYRKNETNSQNCYTYAFNLPGVQNPGDYSYDGKNSSYDPNKTYSATEVSNFVMRDMKKLNKKVRIISAPNEKYVNEQLIAMKVKITNNASLFDYHFAVQLSDGTWADKMSYLAPSRWNKIDGTAITWDRGEGKNLTGFYNSETVYFAMEVS